MPDRYAAVAVGALALCCTLTLAGAGIVGPMPPPGAAAADTHPGRAPVPGATAGNFTNNIMLTGYWPPTGDMIRQFSTNSTQNPNGWAGENWEGRGYNVHSFFPEFPNGTGGSNARGVGDFEIDYQDTVADWNRITAEVRPIAIITFSWTGSQPAQYQNRGWELEARNRNRTSWTNDYLAPLQPTLNPPDRSVPGNHIRYSSLPMDDIRDAVNTADVGVISYIDDFSPTFGGSFLSEFIGYHGVWYHDTHSEPFSDDWNIAAGHIHVGSNTTVAQGKTATEVTLRVLMEYLDSVINDAWLTGLEGARGIGGNPPNTIQTPGIPAPSTALVLIGVAGARLRRRR